MPRPTDEERAAAVRKFYGLDGSTPILAPGFRPVSDAPQGATDFEISVRARLHSLTKNDNRSIAGPKEAEALQEAKLPLTLIDGRGWVINKALARSEAEVKADFIDIQRADDVRKFYGLDGSKPILPPGYLPGNKAPKGATDFEKSMRHRLSSLARNDSLYSAGPKEAAALRDAGLPLIEYAQKKFRINRESAGKASEATADALDQQRADNVRAFYGLVDGTSPFMLPGSLPNSAPPPGATEPQVSTWNRLKSLAARRDRYHSGPKEAAALQEAKIPLNLRQDGRWNINKSAVTSQQYPQNPAIAYGYDPAQGATDQDSALPQGMEAVSNFASAGASSYAASSSSATQHPASWDSFYPMNPATAGSYPPSAYGYSHAQSSSHGGAPAERPSRQDDKPSKRGRLR